jgi:hypothetical protein
MDEHATGSDSRWRWSKIQNNGGLLQNGSVLHPALWNRVLGANAGFDATAEEFPLTVLPRIGKRFCLTRRNCWRMELPQQRHQGVAESGLSIDQGNHSKEERHNCGACKDKKSNLTKMSMPQAFAPGIIKEKRSLHQSLNIFNTAGLTRFLRRKQSCHFMHACMHACMQSSSCCVDDVKWC